MSVLMGWHFFCAISAGISKNINLKNINVVWQWIKWLEESGKRMHLRRLFS